MSTSTPIYLEVCDDLKIYPAAMKQRNHAQFMREHEQQQWLNAAFVRVTTGHGLPAKKTARKRGGRKR